MDFEILLLSMLLVLIVGLVLWREPGEKAVVEIDPRAKAKLALRSALASVPVRDHIVDKVVDEIVDCVMKEIGRK